MAKISTTLLKTDQALTFLDEVASQCHGSGMFEGRSGGFGRIGMIDGKPVKFNTHWKERLFGEKATAEMRESCNQLRKSLYDVAKFVGLDFATLQRLCKGLGMKVERNEQVLSDGTMFQLGVNMEIVDKGLLDRKVVAKFVNELRQVLGASTTPVGIRSGSDMCFSTVSAQARADVRFERTVRMMSFCIADTLMEQGVELPMSPKALRDELAVSNVFGGLANFVEVKDVPTTLTDMVNWTMAKVNLDAREDESGKKLAAALKDDFEIMLDRAGLIDRSRNLRPESLFEWAHGGYVDNKNSIYACPSETRKPGQARFKAWRNKFAESLKEKLNVTQEALDSAAEKFLSTADGRRIRRKGGEPGEQLKRFFDTSRLGCLMNDLFAGRRTLVSRLELEVAMRAFGRDVDGLVKNVSAGADSATTKELIQDMFTGKDGLLYFNENRLLENTSSGEADFGRLDGEQVVDNNQYVELPHAIFNEVLQLQSTCDKYVLIYNVETREVKSFPPSSRQPGGHFMHEAFLNAMAFRNDGSLYDSLINEVLALVSQDGRNGVTVDMVKMADAIYRKFHDSPALRNVKVKDNDGRHFNSNVADEAAEREACKIMMAAVKAAAEIEAQDDAETKVLEAFKTYKETVDNLPKKPMSSH